MFARIKLGREAYPSALLAIRAGRSSRSGVAIVHLLLRVLFAHLSLLSHLVRLIANDGVSEPQQTVCNQPILLQHFVNRTKVRRSARGRMALLLCSNIVVIGRPFCNMSRAGMDLLRVRQCAFTFHPDATQSFGDDLREPDCFQRRRCSSAPAASPESWARPASPLI